MDSIYWFAWIVSRLEVNFMVFRKKNTACKKVDNLRTRVARSEIRSIIFTIPCTFRQIDTYILFSNEYRYYKYNRASSESFCSNTTCRNKRVTVTLC